VGKANLASLGLDDMLLDPEAVLAVEWPEILGTALGTEALTIQLSHAGEGERWLNPVAAGNKHRDLLSLWQRVAHF
jgi:tRNA A37 threonylcarbamoyladenosine biosynthesis protein TsaE